jgi:hypothetical protein
LALKPYQVFTERNNMETKEKQLSERIIAQARELAEQNKRPFNPRRVKHTRYTDADKAAALAHLQSKGCGITEAARDLGLPVATLKDWVSGKYLPSTTREKYGAIKEGMSARLEEIVYQVIDAIPERIPTASLRDLGAILAVAIDKMRLLRNEPTEITESMDRRAMLERLIERTMEEFPGITRERVIEVIRDVKPEAIKFLL